MAKLSLDTVGSLIDVTSAQTTINNNSAAIETAMEKTLSRDGTEPNQMESTLDMNSYAVLNLPQPLTGGSPLRLADLEEFLDTGEISTIPAGGTTGQTLAKIDNADYNVEWSDAGQGTVTSVGLVAPADFNVAGSPVTTAGNITLTFASTPTGTGPIVRQTNPDIIGTAANLTAGNVTTNANLTGPITSTGNATAVAAQTGTGSTFVMQTSPALVTPALGTPASGTLTSCTGLPITGLAAITDFALIGNNSGSNAIPTAIQIPSVTTKVTPGAGDYVLISDQAASGAFKKVTVSSLSTSSGVTSIDSLTGAFTTSNGVTASGNVIGLTAARRTLPTTQVFTSGSGTYTTPANCLWIEVEMAGGGAGGNGSGTTPGLAGAGGNTTFSTFTANGAAAGVAGATGTVGGSASGGYLNKSGANGGNGSGLNSTQGGFGANSPYGGAGVGGAAGAGAGIAAVANSGSGGGGGGVNATPNGGGGGGAGGFLRGIINSPAASYSYAVGAGGTAGTLGTSGAAGGAGGSGLIIVKEYYNS